MDRCTCLARGRSAASTPRRDDRRRDGRLDLRRALRAGRGRRGLVHRHRARVRQRRRARRGARGLALRTPSSAPQEPQPVSRLFAAAKDIQIAGAIWFVAIPALLSERSTSSRPSAERLDSRLAIGAVWLVSALFEALMAPAIGRFSDRRGRLVPLRAGLLGAGLAAAALPWIDHAWLLAAGVVVFAICADRSGHRPCRCSRIAPRRSGSTTRTGSR